MSDTTTTRRKRSAMAGFTAIGMASMLAGCGSGPSEEELSRQQFGDAQDVSAFQSVAECAADGKFTNAECTEAEQNAWNQNNDSAPRFEQLNDCEDQFGTNGCQPRQSFFVPLMTGFLIANALDFDGRKRKKYKYAGLYKDKRDGTYYTGSGGWLYGRSGSGYKVGAKALNPVSAPRVMSSSDVSSRGGFGGRAGLSGGGRSSSGGGWGG